MGGKGGARRSGGSHIVRGRNWRNAMEGLIRDKASLIGIWTAPEERSLASHSMSAVGFRG